MLSSKDHVGAVGKLVIVDADLTDRADKDQN
jgi:hypothetical protein